MPHIAQLLNWLTPLSPLTLDDQRILGLVNAAGRPVHSSDLEEGAAESGSEGPDDPDDPGPLQRAQHALA
ncbi:MAG TPA: hypothetical protein VG873_09825 [Burkholderiales bacterium]|nr:hypothetical protein [Burkholderiales bacterium]